MKRRTRRIRGEAGFTLIELMVSLVMFSVAVAGILGVAVSLTSGYREQRQAIAAESSVRVPMDFIADALRQASPGVPGGLNLTDTAGTTCTSGAISVTNSNTGPDRLDVIYSSGAVVTSTRTIVTAASATVTVTDASQLAQDDYVIITDTSQGHLFKISSITGTTITFGAKCAGTLSWPASDYPEGSIVIRAQHAEFYVDPSVYGVPTLMMDPDGPSGPLAAEPLAEGVEDLQVALGIETGTDNSISEVGGTANDDEWVFNKAGEVAPALSAVRAVRVTLVARATLPALSSTSLFARPAAEDRLAGSADKYRRRVLRSTVEVRNMTGSP